MSAKHSPAPWVAQCDHHRTNRRKRMAMVATSNGSMSIDATGSGESYPQDVANAHLIAAAPELLAAARAALNDRMHKEWPEVADLLIAAITKAEGR
jgi:hypothetical protein